MDAKLKGLHQSDMKVRPMITCNQVTLLNCGMPPDGGYGGRWVNGRE
jgi:hypothetical protein